MHNAPCDPLGFSYLHQGLASFPKCGLASLNSTQARVMLVALSLLLIGGGIYGAVVASNVWGSYVVIGVGASFFLLSAYLFIKKAIQQLRTPNISAAQRLLMQERNSQRRFFEVRDLSLPDRIPRFSSTDIPEEYSVGDLLPLFEQKKSALILGTDRSGISTLFLRLSMFQQDAWFQDNVICFAYKDLKWSVSALKEGFISFEASSYSDSAQTKWLQNLVAGDTLPCNRFASAGEQPFVSRELYCRLWQPLKD